jgi:hypothetical protein
LVPQHVSDRSGIRCRQTFGLRRDPEPETLLTCKRTLTRSAGPATKVAGTAEMAPATASSPIDKVWEVRFGVAA